MISKDYLNISMVQLFLQFFTVPSAATFPISSDFYSNDEEFTLTSALLPISFLLTSINFLKYQNNCHCIQLN